MIDIELQASKLSAVLPIAIHERRNQLDGQRLKILLYSLREKEAHQWLEKLYIVTPDHQKQLLETYCEDVDFIKLDILGEEELFPELGHYAHSRFLNYRRQSLIKVGISKVIETDFFLTLDSDIICLQKITPEQLIVDGRALMDYEDKALHRGWWEAAAEILSTPVKINSPGMSVTPAILSRVICDYVIEEIEAKYQKNWVSALMERERAEKDKYWIEYTLYFLCGQKRKCLSDYHLSHLDEKNIPLIDSNYTIWSTAEIEKLETLYQLPPPSGLFAVLQGASNVTLEFILTHLHTILQIDPDSASLRRLREELLYRTA